jgi:alpha-L-fucosidase
MGGIRPDVWQNDTSVSRTSWSWVEGHDYKDASELIQELVDVVAKNGNLLLNVGPRPDGTIPEEEAALLEAVGDWLAVHGEAIYGSSPWVVFGEGPTAPAAGSFTDAAAAAYTAEDIRFTTMTEVGHDYIYGIGLVRPKDGRMRIRSFGSDSRFIDRPVIDVRVLGSREQSEWTHTGEYLEVVLPDSELAGPGGAVVRLELEPRAVETRIDFFHGLNI